MAAGRVAAGTGERRCSGRAAPRGRPPERDRVRVPWGHAVRARRRGRRRAGRRRARRVRRARRATRRTSPESRATRSCSRAPSREDVRPAGCDLRERGALTRAALIAGALTAMARLTVAYAGERRQFGRPIAAFQAVQQHLVAIAQEASLVGAAAEGAARRAGLLRDRRGQDARLARGAERDARRTPGARRDGNDPGVPAPPLQSPAVGLAQRVRRRAALVGPARPCLGAAGAESLYPAIAGGSAVI